MLRIHNSLSGKLEPFRSLEPGKVRMYVCGITVYDYCHIGHMRMMVAFDVVQRYLRYGGLAVNYVRNITDIDDKIIRRAAENGETIDTLTARFIRAMDEDAATLGVARPDHEPRATQHLPQIVALIEKLIERGHAYVGGNGDVMYSVSSFEGYGQLSGKRLEDLRAGSRVEVDEAKRDPLDFVLWKQSKPGEPSWPSPWGAGRPGWHIECSAMSIALLGEHFDIHGGGMDLKFPHHENEIAQSCGATGSQFANYWMHNGFVNVDSEKMSKSLGNFFTVREVLPHLRHPEVLRYFLVASHYRGPINYTLENLQQADATLGGLYNALRGAPAGALPADVETWRDDFRAAMDDDFNTPKALAVLQRLARELNEAKAQGDTCLARVGELVAVFRELSGVLGICQLDAEQWFRLAAPQQGAAPDQSAWDDAAIAAGIAARLAARKSRNFKEADRLRDEMTSAGILLEDRPDGTTLWRRR
ncbi:MAG TPA: cysteine--tRNA ligase [Steroidobacteraceae bacterium]|nr:cysteine--tRNA ligase [Steroidobacteraceae bacterium]